MYNGALILIKLVNIEVRFDINRVLYHIRDSRTIPNLPLPSCVWNAIIHQIVNNIAKGGLKHGIH